MTLFPLQKSDLFEEHEISAVSAHGTASDSFMTQWIWKMEKSRHQEQRLLELQIFGPTKDLLGQCKPNLFASVLVMKSFKSISHKACQRLLSPLKATCKSSQWKGLSCRITTDSAYIDTCFFLVSWYFFAEEGQVCRPIWFPMSSLTPQLKSLQDSVMNGVNATILGLAAGNANLLLCTDHLIVSWK